jgi:hypothetical protein
MAIVYDRLLALKIPDVERTYTRIGSDRVSIDRIVVMDSGLLAEFIIGPADGRARWLGPGMTESS